MDEFDNETSGTEQSAPLSPLNPLQVMWRHRFLVLFGVVVGLVLGSLYYSQKAPVYQSTAQVLVVKRGGDTVPVSGSATQTFYEDYVSTHLMVVRSREIVERAVKDRKLGSLKAFAGGDAVGAILGGLAASRDLVKENGATPNNIMNLSFRCGESEDCARVLAAIIDNYQDFLDETYTSVRDITLEDIEIAKTTLEESIENKEKDYREFREKAPAGIAGLLNGAEGPNQYIVQMKKCLSDQLEVTNRAEELQDRLEAIKKAKEKKSSQATLLSLASEPLNVKINREAGMDATLDKELFRLKIAEKGLSYDKGKDHPEVINIREQISMLEDFQKEQAKKYESKDEKGSSLEENRLTNMVQALENELFLLRRKEKTLADRKKKYEEEAKKLEAFELKDKTHQQGIALTRQLFTETVKRLEQLNLNQAQGGFEARVLSKAAPGAKVSPIAYQIILSGLMLGLLAGVGGAYLLEVSDKSFRSPEEIRARLRLPIVGHIPYMTERTLPVEIVTSRGENIQLDGALIEFHTPNSVEAEAYRSVRTALYFSTRGERHKVIQVTSPNMGDGKSTLIANLAVAIAQSGRKVILVDADLRRPRIHRVFGLTARKGLAQVIAGTADLSETVQQTVVGGLSVLPCGARPNDPGELLTLPRFADLLEELRDTYDYVLIDTPPLLAVSDPCAVASRVDGVLLTIRVSKNGRPSAQRAKDMLAALKVQIFGVVVNGVGKGGHMSGYGYEHYKYADEYNSAYTSADHEVGTEGVHIPHTREENGKALVGPVAGYEGHEANGSNGVNGHGR